MYEIFRSLFRRSNVSKAEITAFSLNDAPLILRKYGVVIIPREIAFPKLKKEKIIFLKNSMKDLYEGFSKTDFLDYMDLKVEYQSSTKKHAATFARNNSSFILVRDKIYFDKKNSEWNIIDGGLFDFFNPSKGIFNEKIFNYIKITKQISLEVLDQMQKNKKFINPYNNLYIYQSVRNPRCLHSDTHKQQFKSFLSLTDIDNIELGPITYVPKSHKKIGRLRALISSLLSTYFYSDIGNGRHDAVLFGKQEAIPITTRFFDVIIGNQSCVHGDLPTKKQKDLQKLLYVHNLFPLEKSL